MADVTPWLSMKEAVEYAKISRSTIYEMFVARKLRPRKLGRRTLISRTELDRMIESGAAPTGDDK